MVSTRKTFISSGISWWTRAVTDPNANADTYSDSNGNGYRYAFGNVNTYRYCYSPTHADAKIRANAETASHSTPQVVIWFGMRLCRYAGTWQRPDGARRL